MYEFEDAIFEQVWKLALAHFQNAVLVICRFWGRRLLAPWIRRFIQGSVCVFSIIVSLASCFRDRRSHHGARKSSPKLGKCWVPSHAFKAQFWTIPGNRFLNTVNREFRAMSTHKQIWTNWASNPQLSEFGAPARCSKPFSKFAILQRAVLSILHIRQR